MSEATQYTQEEKDAAAQAICNEGRDAGIAFFERHPKLGFFVAEQTQCALTRAEAENAKLREALTRIFPVLEQEQECRELSCLPEPDEHEEDLLTEIGDAVDTVRAALATTKEEAL